MSRDSLGEAIDDAKDEPWFDKATDSISTAFGFIFGGIIGGIAFQRTVAGAPPGALEVLALLGFGALLIFIVDSAITIINGARRYYG